MSRIVFNGLISKFKAFAKLLTIADMQDPESIKQVIGTPSTTADASFVFPINLTNGSGLWYSGMFNISLKDPPTDPILLVTVVVGGWASAPGEEDPPLSSPPLSNLPILYFPLLVHHLDTVVYSAPTRCSGSIALDVYPF